MHDKQLCLALFLFACILMAGCSASRPGDADRASPDASQPAFERSVAPFEVRDATGEPYAFPFLGGLNVPRPQYVDIDADDDPDLFVQEETGRVMFFENTGTPEQPHYTWRSEKYRDLDVGEWYRFRDVDKDGDPDLLAEQPYSYIRYYRNTGTPSEPAFTLAADTLRDTDGESIFSDRQNIPNMKDIDCNEQLDLFLGRLDGTITRYEATSAENGVPRFRHVTDNFQNIEIVNQISQPGNMDPASPAPNRPVPDDNGPAPGPFLDGSGLQVIQNPQSEIQNRKHGANSMVFADVDGDDDPDLLWGDYFEPGLLLIENTGSCETPIFRGEPEKFPPSDPVNTSGYNAPTLTDLDGDDDRDLLVGVLGGAFDPSRTARSNLYFYENDEDRYTLRTRRFLDGIDVGSASLPALSDLDDDGDPDLLLANKIAPGNAQAAHVVRFENTGTPAQPELALTDTLDLPDVPHLAPALGDLDDDGDPDLLVGSWNDGIAFYRNTGTPSAPRFEVEERSYLQLERGSHSTPALGDLDDDGDLDLVVGETSGTLNFFENVGSPSAPRFEQAHDAYPDFDVGRRSVPSLLDWDGDDDLDLVVGTETDGLVFLRNDGTPQEPSFVRDTTQQWPRMPSLATPAFADVDDDGDLDLFSGSQSGGLLFFEHRGTHSGR